MKSMTEITFFVDHTTRGLIHDSRQEV